MPTPTHIAHVAGVLVALSWSQASIAQGDCGDIVFIEQVSSRFPEAKDACRDIVERDGEQYAHFQARIVRVRGSEVQAEFRLPDGTYGPPVAFTPPRSARVRIEGRSYRYGELSSGQNLDVYLPPDRWEIALHEDPDADFRSAESVTTVALTEPTE